MRYLLLFVSLMVGCASQPGDSAVAWRGFRQTDLPGGWQLTEGELSRLGSGGDIVTVDQFEDFEMELEWKVAPGGNSGIFFHVSEDYDYVWETGPEMQVLDNEAHRDGLDPRTSAGANYALHAPIEDVSNPAGEWNHVRLVVEGPHVQHWLNGVLLLEYDLWSPDWEARVAASKFAAMPHYGRARSGHIALQDHGDDVWYRNISIRPL